MGGQRKVQVDDNLFWDFVKWALGVIAALFVAIYGDLRARISGQKKRMDEAVTQKEFTDYKEDRWRRDDEVNRKLDKIDTSTERIHERIDDLLKRGGQP
jgi:hypothetical protein